MAPPSLPRSFGGRARLVARRSSVLPELILAGGVPSEAAERSEGWWAWEDLNFRPHAYQARALTN